MRIKCYVFLRKLPLKKKKKNEKHGQLSLKAYVAFHVLICDVQERGSGPQEEKRYYRKEIAIQVFISSC